MRSSAAPPRCASGWSGRRWWSWWKPAGRRSRWRRCAGAGAIRCRWSAGSRWPTWPWRIWASYRRGTVRTTRMIRPSPARPPAASPGRRIQGEVVGFALGEPDHRPSSRPRSCWVRPTCEIRIILPLPPCGRGRRRFRMRGGHPLVHARPVRHARPGAEAAEHPPGPVRLLAGRSRPAAPAIRCLAARCRATGSTALLCGRSLPSQRPSPIRGT